MLGVSVVDWDSYLCIQRNGKCLFGELVDMFIVVVVVVVVFVCLLFLICFILPKKLAKQCFILSIILYLDYCRTLQLQANFKALFLLSVPFIRSLKRAQAIVRQWFTGAIRSPSPTCFL